MSTTMKICPSRDCNTIMFPKEDKDRKILVHVCRNCNHQEVAGYNCIYRCKIQNDVTADATLPRTKTPCPNTECGHGEAVFFPAAGGGEESLMLSFICVKCGHEWKG